MQVMGPPELSARLVEIAMGEFKALREEIDNRSLSQQALVGLNLTAFGGLFAFVGGNLVEHGWFLLLLAYVCPVLAWLWLYHTEFIELIAKYLRTRAWPLLRTAAGDLRKNDLLGWEEWFRSPEYQKDIGARPPDPSSHDFIARLRWLAPYFLVFMLPAYGVLMAFEPFEPSVRLLALPPTNQTAFRAAAALWGVGLVFTAGVTVEWIRCAWRGRKSTPAWDPSDGLATYLRIGEVATRDPKTDNLAKASKRK